MHEPNLSCDEQQLSLSETTNFYQPSQNTNVLNTNVLNTNVLNTNVLNTNSEVCGLRDEYQKLYNQYQTMCNEGQMLYQHNQQLQDEITKLHDYNQKLISVINECCVKGYMMPRPQLTNVMSRRSSALLGLNDDSKSAFIDKYHVDAELETAKYQQLGYKVVLQGQGYEF